MHRPVDRVRKNGLDRRCARFVLFVGLVLGSLPWAAPAAAQQDGEDDGQGTEPSPQRMPALDQEARALFEAGRVAFEDGRYEAALEHFERAYELSERPELLYNMGTAADRLRRDGKALEYFERYLEARPDARQRVEVEARVAVLREQVQSDADADGRAPEGQDPAGADERPATTEVVAAANAQPSGQRAIESTESSTAELTVLLHMGFAGTIQLDDDDMDGRRDDDGSGLEPTWGAEVRGGWTPTRFLAVGALARVSFWTTEGANDSMLDIDRSMLLDVGPYAEGRFPIRLGAGRLMPYVLFTGGYTASRLDDGVVDAFETALSALGASDPDFEQWGHGWYVGLFGGAKYIADEGYGAVIELGWLRHEFNHDVSARALDRVVQGEATSWFQQLALNVGGVVVF